MRNIVIIIFTFLLFTSCKREGMNKISDHHEKKELPKDKKLPMGFKKIINYNFPKRWNNLKEGFDDQNPNLKIDKISKTGYDSINYFMKRYYSLLYDSIIINKKIKLDFIPQIKIKFETDGSDYTKVDSCYYGKTILETNNYILKLYKNGNKYDYLSGSENSSIVKYLLLVTFDKQNKMKDYLPIYHNNNSLYQYDDSYFYIYANRKITIKYFFSDELVSHFIGEENWNISSDGKFIQNTRNMDTSLEKYPKETIASLTNLYKDSNWDGAYYIKTQIISSEINQVVDIEYFISITNGAGKLRINTKNLKDVWCEGEYYLRKGNGFIYGTGSCDQDDINDFMIKKEKENYYIKSKFFINKDWQLLQKK